jgi:hypothetical protein
MNNQMMVATATVAMGVVGCLFAAPASAICGAPDVASKAMFASAMRATQLRATQEAKSLDATVEKATTANPHALEPGRAIVGMWKFQFTSLGTLDLGIPDGAVLDAGFQTWHADGTELTNSGRPPATGNFCMGVWAYDRSGYRLNHYALGTNPDGSPAGVANLREHVVVSRDGNSLSGQMSIDQYDLSGTTVIVHLDGTFSATRVSVN